MIREICTTSLTGIEGNRAHLNSNLHTDVPEEASTVEVEFHLSGLI